MPSAALLSLLLLTWCCGANDKLHNQQHARIRGLVIDHAHRTGRQLGPMRVLVCGAI